MTSPKGRLWPSHIPFMTIRQDGQIAIIDGFECELRPGDFQYTDLEGEPQTDPKQACGFTFVCPQNNKKCGTIVIGHPSKPPSNPSWQFDGNGDEPTLHPSVNCTGGCKWHGWLENGVWKSC